MLLDPVNPYTKACFNSAPFSTVFQRPEYLRAVAGEVTEADPPPLGIACPTG